MHDFPVTEEFVNTANVNQLHDEAKGLKRDWPASFTHNDAGEWVYRVDRDDLSEADEKAIQAALDSHTPDPDYGTPEDVKVLRSFLEKKNPTLSDVASALKALINSTTPFGPSGTQRVGPT